MRHGCWEGKGMDAQAALTDVRSWNCPPSVAGLFGCRRLNLELSTGTRRLSSHVAVLQSSLEIVFTTTIFLFSGSCSGFDHLGHSKKSLID